LPGDTYSDNGDILMALLKPCGVIKKEEENTNTGGSLTPSLPHPH